MSNNASLLRFDRAMHAFESTVRWMCAAAPRLDGLGSPPPAVGNGGGSSPQPPAVGGGLMHFCEARQLIWFSRAGVYFVFNFHGHRDCDDELEGCGLRAPLSLVFSTDELTFGGRARAASLLSGSRQGLLSAHVPSLTACAFRPSRS